MALIAGAGNPTGGSNPSGTGTGINYIGNHAYVSPGALAASTSETVIANFATGAEYIVGTLTFNAGVQLDNTADIDGAAIEVKYNDEVVLLQVTGNSSIDSPAVTQAELLIPSYTRVKWTVRAENDDAGNFVTAFFVGRVYA